MPSALEVSGRSITPAGFSPCQYPKGGLCLAVWRASSPMGTFYLYFSSRDTLEAPLEGEERLQIIEL